MNPVRVLMRGALRLASATGIEARIAQSPWRRRHLLVLCYHGFSLRDEHAWSPSLYMAGDQFEQRLELLRRSGATVLPLSEALTRLGAGSLPERAVAITVDDGAFDFLAVAQPILQRHAVPVTLYCSTWYMKRNWPVFDVMLRYLLWRGMENAAGPISLEGVAPGTRITTRGQAEALAGRIRTEMGARNATGAEKQHFLEKLAPQVGEDFAGLMAARLFCLLRLEELPLLDPKLVDVQLHTHRHRTPDDREGFLAEIEDNRRALAGAGLPEKGLRHFCYPSGHYQAKFLPWLREAGVVSATTCDPGLAAPQSDPLLLPRFVDAASVPPLEFRGWVSGVRHPLRRRTRRRS